MKHLRETSSDEYRADRDICVGLIDISDDKRSLFLARFINSSGSMAVEGLVSAQIVEGGSITFNHADNDGEIVGDAYTAQIDSRGIIGELVLRDGEVVQMSEGYLYRDDVDKELEDLLAEVERNLVPVRVTMGGAAADSAKRELGIDR